MIPKAPRTSPAASIDRRISGTRSPLRQRGTQLHDALCGWARYSAVRQGARANKQRKLVTSCAPASGKNACITAMPRARISAICPISGIIIYPYSCFSIVILAWTTLLQMNQIIIMTLAKTQNWPRKTFAVLASWREKIISFMPRQSETWSRK